MELRRFVVLASAVFFTFRLSADSFTLTFATCEVTSATLETPSAPVTSKEAQAPSPMQCRWKDSEITCESSLPTGTKTEESYFVVITKGAVLTFTNRDWSEYVVVNTSTGAAVLTSRVSPDQHRIAGAMVCSGTYQRARKPKA